MSSIAIFNIVKILH